MEKKVDLKEWQKHFQIIKDARKEEPPMLINGKKCRKLRVGAFIRPNDIFANGHEIESYSIGKKMKKRDRRYYQVFRIIR